MKAFKYIPPERIDIIKNQEVRFTQVQDLNDPFEFLPFISRLMDVKDATYIYHTYISPLIDQLGDQKILLENIPGDLRATIPKHLLEWIGTLTIKDALSLSPEFHPQNILANILPMDSVKSNTNFASVIRNKWNDMFGVLSLTSINDNITMWSHYAANHSGYVIEFDTSDRFFNKKIKTDDPIRHVREVRYEEKRPDIKIYDSSMNELEMLDFLAEKILLTKSRHWEYEKELRMISNLKETDRVVQSANQCIHLNCFESAAITSIYLGVNVEPLFRDNLTRILQENRYAHVKLFQGSLNPTEYKIEFNEVIL